MAVGRRDRGRGAGPGGHRRPGRRPGLTRPRGLPHRAPAAVTLCYSIWSIVTTVEETK
ncbi:hypothetical protein NOCARDAX2BIS_530039 [Nocardioides sp. AX2bis]|nr:hypothetical protein NOCARDAX2BIS_530039 [Nocardioides sp. AX2bis]